MADPIKYLYILNYWEPKREGILNVIAESDNECNDILTKEEQFPKEWNSLIWSIYRTHKTDSTTNYKPI